jgi:hypothetical protein
MEERAQFASERGLTRLQSGRAEEIPDKFQSRYTVSGPNLHAEVFKNTKAGLPVTETRFLNLRNKTDSVAWVRKRNIQTERPPLAGEVDANFCG